jgi:hypothetical protein
MAFAYLWLLELAKHRCVAVLWLWLLFGCRVVTMVSSGDFLPRCTRLS